MGKRVRNIEGTSENVCNCGSWLAHWEKFSGRKAAYCAELGCSSPATVGGHVTKEWVNGGRWYIIPLCSEHNSMKGKAFEVIDSTTFVSANVKETCGNGGQGS